MVRLGVLALQGDFAAHIRVLRGLGASAVEVRRVRALDTLEALILPGGESGTLLRLMGDEPWFEALRGFHDRGGVLFGTCAGAILLAREVLDPPQTCLGLLDATVRRNGFGRQVDSFETRVESVGLDGPLRAVFIRAPRFISVGPDVDVWADLDGEPVLVRQGSIIAATFHPELTADSAVHRRFLELAAASTEAARAASRSNAMPSSGFAAGERRVPC